jgi:hypothetical protein
MWSVFSHNLYDGGQANGKKEAEATTLNLG